MMDAIDENKTASPRAEVREETVMDIINTMDPTTGLVLMDKAGTAPHLRIGEFHSSGGKQDRKMKRSVESGSRSPLNSTVFVGAIPSSGGKQSGKMRASRSNVKNSNLDIQVLRGPNFIETTIPSKNEDTKKEEAGDWWLPKDGDTGIVGKDWWATPKPEPAFQPKETQELFHQTTQTAGTHIGEIPSSSGAQNKKLRSPANNNYSSRSSGSNLVAQTGNPLSEPQHIAREGIRKSTVSMKEGPTLRSFNGNGNSAVHVGASSGSPKAPQTARKGLRNTGPTQQGPPLRSTIDNRNKGIHIGARSGSPKSPQMARKGLRNSTGPNQQGALLGSTNGNGKLGMHIGAHRGLPEAPQAPRKGLRNRTRPEEQVPAVMSHGGNAIEPLSGHAGVPQAISEGLVATTGQVGACTGSSEAPQVAKKGLRNTARRCQPLRKMERGLSRSEVEANQQDPAFRNCNNEAKSCIQNGSVGGSSGELQVSQNRPNSNTWSNPPPRVNQEVQLGKPDTSPMKEESPSGAIIEISRAGSEGVITLSGDGEDLWNDEPIKIGESGRSQEMRASEMPRKHSHNLLSMTKDSELVTARPVEEPDLPMADTFDLERLENEKEARRNRSACHSLSYLGCGLSLLLNVVLVALLLTNMGGENTIVFASATGAPSAVPSAAPTWEGNHILNLLPSSTVDRIFQESPQRDAYGWLLQDPNWRTYSPVRLVQRFALATLYYSSGGDGWLRNVDWIYSNSSNPSFGWMDPTIHECFWAFRNHTDYEDRSGLSDAFFPESPCALQKNQEEDQDGVEEEMIYEHLWLPWTELTGTLPDEIFLLTSLRSLMLSANKNLVGTLSTQVGLLTSLEVLSLSYTGLSGTIPESLSQCSNLTSIMLTADESSDKRFCGTIPTFFGKLQALQHVWIDHQNFTGPIPSQVGLLTDLGTLYLSGTSLTGSQLPFEVGKLESLYELDLVSTGISGHLPSQFGMLSSLQHLYMSHNSLSGTLPTQLGSLSNITVCFGQGNAFSGTLPTELGLWNKASLVTFSANQLYGQIPTELGLWNSSDPTWLSLQENNLNGTIPSELGQIENLEEIFLSGNSLTGSIPQEIAELSFVTNFQVSSNQLSGEFPIFASVVSGFFDAAEEWAPYREFNISDNAFTGILPPDMCRLESTQHLLFDCPSNSNSSSSSSKTTLCGCSCSCATTVADAPVDVPPIASTNTSIP